MKQINLPNHSINIYYDQIPQNPREWSTIGRIFAKHPRLDLSDHTIPDHFSDGEELVRINSIESLLEYINQEHGEVVVSMPLYLLDHSGLWLRTSRFREDPQGWDTSNVGVIVALRKDILQHYNRERFSDKLLDQVKQNLCDEVEVFSKYLNGETYGFKIECRHDKCGDTYYNYFDLDNLEKNARSIVRACNEKQLKTYIQDNVPLNYRWN